VPPRAARSAPRGRPPANAGTHATDRTGHQRFRNAKTFDARRTTWQHGTMRRIGALRQAKDAMRHDRSTLASASSLRRVSSATRARASSCNERTARPQSDQEGISGSRMIARQTGRSRASAKRAH
jgi:hypothetical protein